MLYLLSGPPGFTCRISFAPVFSLFTVEPLSLLYLLFISWFICSRRLCINKLCKSNIYVSWSTSELRVRLERCETGLSPPVKYFTDCAKVVLHLWIIYVFVLSYVCYVFVRVCLYVHCGHLLGMGWPLGSRLWCLTVSLSLSHWYPGSGVVLDLSISDLGPLTSFVHELNGHTSYMRKLFIMRNTYMKFQNCSLNFDLTDGIMDARTSLKQYAPSIFPKLGPIKRWKVHLNEITIFNHHYDGPAYPLIN